MLAAASILLIPLCTAAYFPSHVHGDAEKLGKTTGWLE